MADGTAQAGATVAAQGGTLLRALRGAPAWRGTAWLAGGLAGTLVANAVLQVLLNRWQGAFFDAVEKRDLPGFATQLGVFLALVTGLLTLIVGQTWLQETLKVRLRAWLTDDLTRLWLVPGRAWQLSLAGPVSANPDQRIHEDARKLCELSTDLGSGLLQATLLLLSFVGVLWALSENVTFRFDGQTIAVPGYMVWCALGFSLGGSLLTWWLGSPLVGLNDTRFGLEAVLRFELVRVSDAAEGVALYRGEPDERRRIGKALDRVTAAAQRIADRVARLTWVTSGYGWLAIVAPILVAAPGYFAGQLSFGELMQVVGAFGQVQAALRWYVDNYARIAEWRATLLRVAALREALVALGEAEPAGPSVALAPHPEGRLGWRGLRLTLPDGTVAAPEADAEIGAGESVLVLGDALSGKSTFFRAMAGLWRRGERLILRPPEDAMTFLPGRPYLPPGTLRDVVTYPNTNGRPADAAINAAFRALGLGHLCDTLDRRARWKEELPLDEQQRLVVARALLRRPKWLVMDDALAALDPEGRRQALHALRDSLPEAALVVLARVDQDGGMFGRTIRLARVGPAGAAQRCP